jgi:hypothetical protein
MMCIMTQTTPCATGNECKVPRQRQAVLDRDDLTEEQKQTQLAKLSESCDHRSHPDDWFEDPGVGYATPAYWRRERAKFLCLKECPVRLQCLAEGFKPENMGHGTYGGHFVEERELIVAEIKRRRGDTDEGTDAPGVPASAGPQEQAASAEA